jgi:Na+/melibiose symporter-like transporter
MVTRLGWVAGILVPALLMLPLLLGSQYRITREKHAEIREALDKRRATGSLGPPPDPGHEDLLIAVLPLAEPPR